jgi:signal transduction histidine kinase
MTAVLLSWTVTLAVAALLARAHRRLVLVDEACHEVRNPLFAVQLGLHGLKGAPERLAAIELELARAGRALEDLSAARSGGRGASRPERVDLAALIRAHAPAWAAVAAEHGARLRVEEGEDASVVADPVRVAQACANLVANAAEHGGGVVRVAVRGEGASARIEVADDGPGLPRGVAARARVARVRRGRRGHGLALAAAIAGQHGGRLRAAGARVVLELPAAT